MPRKRVDVSGYDRERLGRPEAVRDYTREQDVRGTADATPSMARLRRRGRSVLTADQIAAGIAENLRVARILRGQGKEEEADRIALQADGLKHALTLEEQRRRPVLDELRKFFEEGWSREIPPGAVREEHIRSAGRYLRSGIPTERQADAAEYLSEWLWSQQADREHGFTRDQIRSYLLTGRGL